MGGLFFFCDDVTKSIEGLINITEYRRRRQIDYNEKNGIIPVSVKRADQESLQVHQDGKKVSSEIVSANNDDLDVNQVIGELQSEMQDAASKLEFEKAALIRDQIEELKKLSKISFIIFIGKL